ncbi:MAG TPA: bifunctional phosphoribosyl-AMP cyclohydrolase/phosphoribosyl-ATP diphosphatase HisIE [bacterium]|nr:bifunctional phosphoribosyl-AMP cyclohydrolase/phosphoribosyl-ATP diphosphatase HisIE [bacterium]
MDESGTVRFDADGLVTAVAQDGGSGEVLMVAHMDREALRRTLDTGQGWYWSRSRNRLWRKGETSGHTQRVTEVRADCDGDAVLLRVEQTGAACHTGHRSCFYRAVAQRDGEAAILVDRGGAGPENGADRPIRGDAEVLSEIAAVLNDRRAAPREGSYTTRLFAEGLARLNEKIMEEAAEVTRAARKETRGRLVEETADLWFHTLALLVFLGVSPREVFAELAQRRR